MLYKFTKAVIGPSPKFFPLPPYKAQIAKKSSDGWFPMRGPTTKSLVSVPYKAVFLKVGFWYGVVGDPFGVFIVGDVPVMIRLTDVEPLEENDAV